MHFIYIIYSPGYDKYYVGETLDVIQRLNEHNSKFYSASSTGFTDDWNLRLQMKFQNRSEARIVEKYIKSMKSKKFIISLISNSDYLSEFKQLVAQKFNIEIMD